MEKIPDQPIIHLLRENDADALIDQLSGHLGTVVPHVALDVGGTPAENQRQRSVQIRKLLDNAALRLRDADAWPRIGRLRFRRYALLSWLLKKNVPPTNLTHAPHSDTRQLLREYLSSRRPRRAKEQSQHEAAIWESAAQSLPWYLFVLSLAFFPLYYAWWVRRGRVARWFMRQHYLSPRESADFPSFARRLITTPSRWENAEQVRKLLVHAFLTDLAESYTRRLWRWQWVPKDCYPVLLLRNLGDATVGKVLIRLLNEVRNETGAPDPLLVIGSGSEPLQDSETPSAPATLETWPEKLQEARRKRSNTAWYVMLRVADEPPAVDDEPWVLLGQTSLTLKRSKLLRRVPALLMFLLLLGGSAGYLQQYHHHCGRSWWPWTNVDLWSADDECVGIADSAYRFSSDISETSLRDRLIDAQDEIDRENALAEGKHRLERNLPYVTIVYFSTLTGRDPDSSTLDGVAAELEGLAQAQAKARRDGGVAIRVVLANGGASMRQASEVADRIVEFAARPSDAPVVGVVGLGGSWAGTARAISTLGRHGLTTVGTVTSADEFPKLSRLYHQVGPTNQWEAQVVAQHVRNLGSRNVTVYYNENDIYSNNLALDIKAQLGDMAELEDSQHSIPADSVRCSPDSLAFFAGRADQFGNYLSAMQDQCVDVNDRPRLMASDDTTKFLLDRQLPRGVQLDYIDFTGLRVQEGTDGLTGRAMLAFDAVDLVRQAVRKVTDGQDDIGATPLNGQAVWYGIARLSENRDGIRAISGPIDFGTPSGQVPVRKAISVMRIVGDGQDRPEAPRDETNKPWVVMHCGNTPLQTGPCPP
ncbi:hypothetical protein [Saccharopolyspora phatthalungensis]|uniref:ABC-type branched-subunit amino acid transport system substrate-binding protein n=1 Tax=Saccharopolyspora phatthalungensis TaxID=664693 RepID=A0A840QHD6_9PSEU|nr:hypothetical protein [Saccharopolyspora phatthalungensis]MBB5156653.1 hypothetical protein [Saccharopolyspora phatthalungensis]